MPPKKVVKILGNNEDKGQRRRPKKEKAVLKPPSTMKVKNQPQGLKNASKDQNFYKDPMLKNANKIDLANEVVRLHFKKVTEQKCRNEIVVENAKKSLNKSISEKFKMANETFPQNTVQRKKNIAKKKTDINRKQVVTSLKKNPVRRKRCSKVTTKKCADKTNNMVVKKNCILNKQSEDVPDLTISEKNDPVTYKRTRKSKNARVINENISIENLEQAPLSKLINTRTLCVNRKVVKAGPKKRNKLTDISIEKTSTFVTISNENMETTEEKEIPGNVKPDGLIERRKSCDSNSGMSWIKNISSSSANTLVTVASNDFIRIDNKIPVLKLTHLDSNLQNNNLTCNTSKNIENDCDTSSVHTILKKCTLSGEHSLNQSSMSAKNSSTSTFSTSSNQTNSLTNSSSCNNKYLTTLEKLSLNILKFDGNLLQFGSKSKSTCTIAQACNVKKATDVIFQSSLLKEEADLLSLCQKLEKNYLFSRSDIDETDSTNKNINNIEFQEFGTPSRSGEFESIYSPYKNRSIEFPESNIDYNEQHCENRVTDKTSKVINNTSLNENKTINEYNNNSDHQDDNDDDDALSLFAESITGIDSFRRNSSFTNTTQPVFEEYVPESITKDILNTSEPIYQPTKIMKDTIDNNKICTNICEKQNADSTSVYRTQVESSQKNVMYADRTDNFPEKSFRIESKDAKSITSVPRLMASIHLPDRQLRNNLFKGYCFYYLVSTCHNRKCRYPHVLLEPDDFKKKLSKLSEERFIHEYMFMRKRNVYRRRYGICFVDECLRRQLTRILVEMAIDFIRFADNSPEDNIIKTDTTESILLYLNNVELNSCKDLLKYKFNSNKCESVCDVFMDTMAVSHNFQRFKKIFIKLTQFMSENRMSFSLNVASSILERVCILPYNEELSRALITIIKNTDKSIYSNSKIDDLEKLLCFNNDLCDDLRLLKDEALANEPMHGYTLSYKNNDKLDNNIVNSIENDIRYSPDTTKSDNVTKPSVELVFKKTIDLNRLKSFKITCAGNASVSKCMEDQQPNTLFSKWKNQDGFDRVCGYKNKVAVERPRYVQKRRSDQRYGGSPSKFKRINGE